MARKRGEWSGQEVDTIRRLYGVTPTPRIAYRLGRTEVAVEARARVIFGSTRRRGEWREEERERLRAMVGVAPPETMALVLGRSRREIQATLRALARLRRQGRWSAEEKTMLRRLHGTRSDAAMALLLGRTERAVRIMAGRLCLAKDKGLAREGEGDSRPMPRWTEGDVARLRSYYPVFPNLEVARRLGRSVRAVVSKASLLGLRKNRSVLSRAGRANVAQRRDR